MVCAAAGMAHSGLVPFVSTFALFGAGRAYEQIRNSVCYANANVKFGLCHAGISTGEDGGSHQSVEDIALMRILSNMRVFVPCDAMQRKKAVRAAVSINGLVYIRIARPPKEVFTDENTPFIPGQANIVRQENDVCLMTTGLMAEESLKAAELLARDGVSAAGVDHICIKPFGPRYSADWHIQRSIYRYGGRRHCGGALYGSNHPCLPSCKPAAAVGNI